MTIEERPFAFSLLSGICDSRASTFRCEYWIFEANSQKLAILRQCFPVTNVSADIWYCLPMEHNHNYDRISASACVCVACRTVSHFDWSASPCLIQRPIQIRKHKLSEWNAMWKAHASLLVQDVPRITRPFNFFVMISSGVMMWTTPPQPVKPPLVHFILPLGSLSISYIQVCIHQLCQQCSELNPMNVWCQHGSLPNSHDRRH